MLTFDDWKLSQVTENSFHIDGGAMYGLIPKKIWTKFDPPDEANRVLLDLNVYVLSYEDQFVVIDTGLGDALDERTRKIYPTIQRSQLAEGMANLGIKREQVTHVIFTHLHVDHSGGAFIPGPKDEPVPHFPNAVHWTQAPEWRDAMNPNERTAAAYPTALLSALPEEQLRMVTGDHEVLPGLWLRVTGGHTEGHQMVELRQESRSIYITGDLIPSRFHLKLPYLSAADTFPLVTMEAKRALLAPESGREKILCLDHERRDRIFKLTRPDDDPPYEVLD